MRKALWRLSIAVPVSVAWLLLAAYTGASGATSFDLVAITALMTSPAVGWTWHWVMEKPAS
jgi:hypothetical protein